MYYMPGLQVRALAACGQEEVGGSCGKAEQQAQAPPAEVSRIRPTADGAGLFQHSGKLLVLRYLILFQVSFFCFYFFSWVVFLLFFVLSFLF